MLNIINFKIFVHILWKYLVQSGKIVEYEGSVHRVTMGDKNRDSLCTTAKPEDSIFPRLLMVLQFMGLTPGPCVCHADPGSLVSRNLRSLIFVSLSV